MSDNLLPYECRLVGDSSNEEVAELEEWVPINATTYADAAERFAFEYDFETDGYVAGGDNSIIVEVRYRKMSGADILKFEVTGKVIAEYNAEETE